MSQLEHIQSIEKRLWSAADTLRTNSTFASNEYFLPVMGLVFLRHAFSRYLAVREQIKAKLPTRGGQTRTPSKEDFSQRGAIYLRKEAHFNYLVSLPDSADRIKAVINAMESIEKDYKNLQGILPKKEYLELSNDVLGQLLRTLNPDELKKVSGDVFGRIYEYFLTKFADQKAHDGGEFYTPISLVSLIAHVVDPRRGTVLDPACGSGGMFVQSARTVQQGGRNPAEQLTFRGLEKNATTISLAKMNLAVHGLEGNIQKAISYYEDPHQLTGKADYVMANPPFNVDEIDAERIKSDTRLPFGLPGVNNQGKVTNGNYVWISYFYSYLSPKGRAGFVMSSQASSAGGGEARVRQKIIESGDVDVMISIRSNFFYTRTVPCELWFLNRAKPKAQRDYVLMVDARGLYRKITRKIYDFSPEQQQNLLAIIWLYRGQISHFLELVANYCTRALQEGQHFFTSTDDNEAKAPLPAFLASLASLRDVLAPFLDSRAQNDVAYNTTRKQLNDALCTFHADAKAWQKALHTQPAPRATSRCTVNTKAAQHATNENKVANATLKRTVHHLASLAQDSDTLANQAEHLYKLAVRLLENCEQRAVQINATWDKRAAGRACKIVDTTRNQAVQQLERMRYFYQQAQWLTVRFPDAKLRDVAGLVKRVHRTELKNNDWSLTPGRYVGVATEQQEQNIDFAKNMRCIHAELEELNNKAASHAAAIQKNFADMDI